MGTSPGLCLIPAHHGRGNGRSWGGVSGIHRVNSLGDCSNNLRGSKGWRHSRYPCGPWLGEEGRTRVLDEELWRPRVFAIVGMDEDSGEDKGFHREGRVWV